MEDKKVLEFINKNHEKSYREHLKTKKINKTKQTFKSLIFCIIAFLMISLCLFNIHSLNKKSINNCMNKGNSYDYCVYQANN